MRIQYKQDGITLLITLLLMGVLLGVSASLLNITLKQFLLSGIARDSEVAFQAANAGMECALSHDRNNDTFQVNDDVGVEQSVRPAISCMGSGSVQANNTLDDDTDGLMKSGEEQRFQFQWGINPVVCSEVSVYKFASSTQVTLPDGTMMRDSSSVASNVCPVGADSCTVIQARGYNVACGQVNSGARVVEREYTQVY